MARKTLTASNNDNLSAEPRGWQQKYKCPRWLAPLGISHLLRSVTSQDFATTDNKTWFIQHFIVIVTFTDFQETHLSVSLWRIILFFSCLSEIHEVGFYECNFYAPVLFMNHIARTGVLLIMVILGQIVFGHHSHGNGKVINVSRHECDQQLPV